MQPAVSVPHSVPAAAASPEPANAFQAQFDALRQQAPALRRQDVAARRARLQKLSNWLHANRTAIQDALYADFRKPAAETDMTEIWTSLVELKHTVKHLKRWMAPRRVGVSLALLGTRSWVQVEPKGVVLIISPWNYPFYLAVGPLISAIAAGNAVVIKPAEQTPATSALLQRLCEDLFQPNEVLLLQGDKEVATELLKLPWDHIFFTGSPEVGKIVMRAAACHLSGLTLELGGKNPAVVDETANLRDAAEKIVWGKFLNNGQTCVAPDYLLVQESVQPALLTELAAAIQRAYNPNGAGIQQSDSLARVVNQHHFARLAGLLEDAQTRGATVVAGGTVDASQNYIEPTILTNVPAGARILEEEIFGPLLPVLTFKNLSETAKYINARLKPLAQYVFSGNAENRRYLLENISAGGAGVNETVLHFAHPELPTGGVGNSGLGKAHGHSGFLAFSNEKGVMRQRVGFTGIKAMYPPYTPRVRQLISLLVKHL
ncbi:aldehyde dehydrogenase family protein [Hymenobacter sp. BT770]|uniref:aldehyde dehydrogenase family protein n=1 Tax=Hymenobacter sp. BT770 TaxID=2886942 RepID=UPI001D0F9337|nr:aldehyde dehydrogenase family protein [Hymenobacter sp. BT770]MCC3154461.1 aldehyde dehydrogenase family protein [Hymenobacter sp. BT770]MDO3416474.1 aldehyde dehydrogenase family protein [Hymenobacter sp. BT770]